MLLKDLVHRSALKNRSVGEASVGLPTGMDYYVFELTDHTFPVGWHGNEYVFGVTEAIDPASVIQLSLFLELAEELTGTNECLATLFEPLSENYSFLSNLILNLADTWGALYQAENVARALYIPQPPAEPTDPVPPARPLRAAVTAYNTGGGPITQPITVVRARIALIVI